MSDRNAWLALDDQSLLRLCRCEACRGTGPGGQKRNKTSTAIRLVHLPTGIAVEDDATRSQHQNRDGALRKLRLQLAMELREEPVADCGPMPSEKARQPFWVAVALDALENCGFRIAEAAALMGLSTARLGKDLSRIPSLWQKVNSARVERGMERLR
ncbi:MAG: peptide chain release factor-like protein [Victivallales bacterium]|nr:peptide chain release factor-like protein [Victivallales bacterium]